AGSRSDAAAGSGRSRRPTIRPPRPRSCARACRRFSFHRLVPTPPYRCRRLRTTSIGRSRGPLAAARPITKCPWFERRNRMSGAELEAEYNNRARVPEHQQIFAQWARDAATYRTRASAEKRAELGLTYGPSARQTIDIFHAAID